MAFPGESGHIRTLAVINRLHVLADTILRKIALPVDFAPILASNRDLSIEVQSSSVRDDI